MAFNLELTCRLIFYAFLLNSCACGPLRSSGTITLNESAPDGVVVSQGSFSGLNDRDVSGIAAIYLTTEGTYTVRLESFSAPSLGLLLKVEADGETVLMTSLRGTSGNQNYSTSASGSPSWTSVKILSSSGLSPTNEYGVALLVSVD